MAWTETGGRYEIDGGEFGSIKAHTLGGVEHFTFGGIVDENLKVAWVFLNHDPQFIPFGFVGHPNPYTSSVRAVASANDGGYLVNAMKYTPIYSRSSHSLVLPWGTGNSCLQFSTLRSESSVSRSQLQIHPPKKEGEYFRAADLPLPTVLSEATMIGIIKRTPIQYP